MNFHLRRMSGFAFAASALLCFSSCKKEADKQLAFSQSSLTTGTAAAEQSISISANVNWTLTIPEEAASWISLDKINGASTTTVKISVAANSGKDQRSANLTLKSEGLPDASLSITQKGLIEWKKEIPNLNNQAILEVADGYIVGGVMGRSFQIYKLSKTDFSLLNSKQFNVEGTESYYLYDMEPMPGGGVVIAGRLEKNITERDAYFLQLDNNLNTVKEKVVDFKTYEDRINAITPLTGGFVIAITTSSASRITKIDENFDPIPEMPLTPAHWINDLKSLPNGEFIAAGSFSSSAIISIFNSNLETLKAHREPGVGHINSFYRAADGTTVACGFRRVSFKDTAFAIKLGADLSFIKKTDITFPQVEHSSAYSIIPLSNGGYAVSGRLGNYDAFSTRINDNFDLIPGKEIQMLYEQYFDGVNTSTPLSDGGYLITGPGKSDNKSNLIRINP